MKKATKSEKRAAVQRRVALFATIPVQSNGLVDWFSTTFDQREAFRSRYFGRN